MEPDKKSGNIRKCANCGASNGEFNNLCQDCFLKDRPVILRRVKFKIPICRECGNVYYLGSWTHPNVDEEEQLVQGVKYQINKKYKFSTRKNLNVEAIDARITGIESGQDKVIGQLQITWKVDPFTPLVKLEEAFEGKLKWRRCTSCQSREEVKFSAKLQFRFTDRYELGEEMAVFQEKMTHYQSNEGLHRLQRARGGYDVILSSKTVAKEIARYYQREHGAAIKTTLETTGFDRHTTKTITREITVIRFPDLLVGDLVEISGNVLQIHSYRQGSVHFFDFSNKMFKNTNINTINQATLAVAREDFHDFQVMSINLHDSSLVAMSLSSDDYQAYDLNVNDFPGVKQGEEFRAAIYKEGIYFDHYSRSTGK
ncbi:MAG: NMD3-related protein [Candidatus Hodarchaeales archaeon]